ncbi:hypothetical protein [Devosia sp. RR2S18]|uniref:hypothetical protein n=1 Tax=Devosia rhizosphaerae TaxID=3049774 RepID=UPI00254190F1|nr:hypothetical protein [Devosia sp. RR2S18]WIJ23936.1 hypothetical protein QOV41_12905 [Devosia sp. RR2S18]
MKVEMLRAFEHGGMRAGAVPESMIGAVYQKIVDEGSLQAMVDALHRIRPGINVLLFGEDRTGLQGNFLIHRGLEKDAERAYMTGLRLDDPYISHQ